jgi:hypothetical protein
MEENILYNREHTGIGHRLQPTQYWIWTIKDGRLVVIAYRPTEQEAYDYGNSVMPDEDIRVTPIATTNTDTAVRIIKGKLLENTSDLNMAIKRARRKI